MIYVICSMLVMIGVLGLVAQLLLGVAHVGYHGHSHGHHSGAPGHSNKFTGVLTLLSPLTLFSLCIGTGGTGLLLKHAHLPWMEIAVAAPIGGFAFYKLVVQPLLTFVFKFASRPSKALEGMVAGEAEAMTSFDARGKGIVRLTIDGGFVRILATLEPDDRPSASEIRPGERLLVTSVDGRTNSCRVARF